jgi:hypothetical protein
MASPPSAHVIAKAEARAQLDPDFCDLLARLVDAPSSSAGRYERLAAQGINDARQRNVIEEFKAAALPTGAVQELLGVGTPQAVHRLRSRGRILGLAIGNQTWFPEWQFSAGAIRPDLAEILERLNRFTSDVIAADRTMRLVRDDLGGLSIAGSLDQPETASTAWAVLDELSG